MKPEIDALLRFPMFRDFRAEELAAVARRLVALELAPGEVLFREGEPGSSMYFLHMGRVAIDRQTTPGNHEVLAELDAPSILGEMAILEDLPRSARAVAVRPCLLWEMDGAQLMDLAATADASAYKILHWVARGLSNRLRRTNDKLIDIYAKPYKSIMELKERLRELQPGIFSVGFGADHKS